MTEQTLLALQPLFVLAAATGLFLALGTEQSQIVAKTRGAFAGKIATGYMNSMRIMVCNRLGAILYVMFVSLCIDTGISNRGLLVPALVGTFGVLGYNVFLTAKRSSVLAFPEGQGTVPLRAIWLQSDRRYSVAAFAATLCNILGLTLPFLLANSFPDYRLTLANTGFLLNAVFTLLNVILLEGRYAALIDGGSHCDAYLFVVRIFLSRVLATATALVGFAALWLAFGG